MTTLLEELKARKTVAIIKVAEEFAQEMKEKVKEAADKGYSAYKYGINKEMEHVHIYKSVLFRDKLNEFMDGVEVTLETEERTNILTKAKYHVYYLLFSWSEE